MKSKPLCSHFISLRPLHLSAATSHLCSHLSSDTPSSRATRHLIMSDTSLEDVTRPQTSLPPVTREGIARWHNIVQHIEEKRPYAKPNTWSQHERLAYQKYKEGFRQGLRIPAGPWDEFAVLQNWTRCGIPDRVREGDYHAIRLSQIFTDIRSQQSKASEMAHSQVPQLLRITCLPVSTPLINRDIVWDMANDSQVHRALESAHCKTTRT